MEVRFFLNNSVERLKQVFKITIGYHSEKVRYNGLCMLTERVITGKGLSMKNSFCTFFFSILSVFALNHVTVAFKGTDLDLVAKLDDLGYK